MANFEENKNNAKKGAIPDVLAYNNCGTPLYSGIFVIDRKVIENQIAGIVQSYMKDLNAKDIQVVITAFRDDRTRYDEESKSNVSDFRTEFQVRLPERNAAVSKADSAAAGNVFLSGRTEYTEQFKNFVNAYGIQGEKGNAIEGVNKHKRQVIVLVNPEKLFGTLFDTKNIRYNEENAQKCTRLIEVRIKNLYDHEDPLSVIGRNAQRRIGSNSQGDANLTGFVVIKSYADVNSDTPYRYRAAYNARKKHYEED